MGAYNTLGDCMKFKTGDLVTRKSYNNDYVFKVDKYENGRYILYGLDIRLYADSEESDLELYDGSMENDDVSLLSNLEELIPRERNQYFYLPGKILHVDGDPDYLKRCLDFYKNADLMAYGVYLNENEFVKKIGYYLEKVKPDILIITGHDAILNDGKIQKYKNSGNFIETVRTARSYEKSHDKLIIIAGACQSNYEELIKAGANFASSPRRINIHALDPAIVASIISLSDHSNDIDLIGILKKTKYGAEGIGGIKTKGCMYVGYPR